MKTSHTDTDSELRLILVYGLPGSGKTYFGKALAKRTNVARYNSDEERSELGLRGNYTEEARKMVYERLLTMAQARLEQGKSVIIDANFSLPSQRELFRHLATEMEAKYYPVLLEADKETSMRRLKQSRAFSEADAGVWHYLKQVASYEKEHVLCLYSTDHNLEEMLLKALSYLHYEEN